MRPLSRGHNGFVILTFLNPGSRGRLPGHPVVFEIALVILKALHTVRHKQTAAPFRFRLATPGRGADGAQG